MTVDELLAAAAELAPEERAELNILTTAERMQPTLPGVEDAIVETRQGSDVPADPPSIESASTLVAGTTRAMSNEAIAPAVGEASSHETSPVVAHPSSDSATV